MNQPFTNPSTTPDPLDFQHIIQQLLTHTLSYLGREKVEMMSPSNDVGQIQSWLAEKQRGIVEDRIRRKMDAALQKYKANLQEAIVCQRGGRFVLPVRRDSKRLVRGTVTYDLDIVLESKDTRRKRKIMAKRHVDGLTIERERGQQ